MAARPASTPTIIEHARSTSGRVAVLFVGLVVAVAALFAWVALPDNGAASTPRSTSAPSVAVASEMAAPLPPDHPP